ncbi:RDD family protein [Lentibacillus saliphilus]|uniref:RDD family protein n=1 Tax=Lentibacillus saliphilus TaxID=2737028 RepID=UPI001C2FB589|nr:RDD family protein [Lentibacillus saliphilus]
MNILKDSPVGMTERGIALIIDLVITFCFALLINTIVDYHPVVIAVIFSYFYETFLPLLWDGYTIGKRILGIRIAHLTNKKLTLGAMIIGGFLAQLLYYILAGILLIASIYFVSTREDKRSIHDLLAQTYVTSNVPEYN